MAGVTAEQFYATHCAVGDGYDGGEGFGLRAASATDAALLQFALRFPGHSLPSGMSHGLDPALAPVRLARAFLPDNRVALVRSGYLPWDSSIPRRPGSYFTHGLVYRELSLREAVLAWGAVDWQGEYAAGATRNLAPFTGTLAGTLLGDAALGEFLSPAGRPSPDQGLGSVVFPARLGGAVPRRRRLLRLTLAAALRLLKDGSGARHLYLLAEPGLVALLLYGVARLLPAQLADRLTFSTYENPATTLRESDASVLGTWTPDGAVPADFYTLGYALDTRQGQPSPELEEGVPGFVDRLLDLAAQRNWTMLDDLHALWGLDPGLSPDTLDRAAALQPRYRRLVEETASAEDFVELDGGPLGKAVLDRLAETAWPLILKHSLRDSKGEWRRRFAPRLCGQRERLVQAVADRLQPAAAGNWQHDWNLVKAVAGKGAADIFETALSRAQRQQPKARPPAGMRKDVLREWGQLSPKRTELPPPMVTWLMPETSQELDSLVSPAIPVLWFCQLLYAALGEQRLVPAIAAFLLTTDEDEVVKAFCRFVGQQDGPSSEERLGPLFSGGGRDSVRLYLRLSRHDLALKGEDLGRLLERARAWDGAWMENWLQGENLATITAKLPPGCSFLTHLWNACCNNLNQVDLKRADERRWEKLERLEVASRQIGRGNLSEFVRTIENLGVLRYALDDPGRLGDKEVAELSELMRRRFLDAPTLLKQYFAPWMWEGGDEAKDRVGDVLASARLFYPDEMGPYRAVLEVAKGAPPEDRVRCHSYLLRQVPLKRRMRVLCQFVLELDPTEAAQLVGVSLSRSRKLLLGACGLALFGLGFLLGWLLS